MIVAAATVCYVIVGILVARILAAREVNGRLFAEHDGLLIRLAFLMLWPIFLPAFVSNLLRKLMP